MSVDPLQATTAGDLGIEKGDTIRDGPDEFTVERIPNPGAIVVRSHDGYETVFEPGEIGGCDNCDALTMDGTRNPNTPVLCVGCYKRLSEKRMI